MAAITRRPRTLGHPAAEPTPSRAIRRLRVVNPLAGLGGLAWLAVVTIPLYWVVLTSLRSQNGFFSASQLVPPASPTLANYQLVLGNQFGTYLGNSVIVTASAVIIILVVAAMASYGIVRDGNRGFTGTAFRLFLLGLAIPLQATIIPIYYVITRLHLYDTLIAVILPSAAFTIPVTVLILVNFLRDVPSELFESMRVDGAGEWRMLWSLAIPLARPALVTVAIYDALQVWNGFLFPLILTQSPSLQVLPLALFNYQGQYTINVPAILAAVVLSLLPILALYIVGRRQLVSGLTAGAGKLPPPARQGPRRWRTLAGVDPQGAARGASTSWPMVMRTSTFPSLVPCRRPRAPGPAVAALAPACLGEYPEHACRGPRGAPKPCYPGARKDGSAQRTCL